MAQVSSSNPNSLPGIVTDQPEIFESEPSSSEDTGVNDLYLLSEPSDEAIALIEVPIKQAFSYFAERENEIAKFYVQRHGEYKIAGDKPEEETEIEKYHRLVSEVNELLNKFQAEKASKISDSQMSAVGSLNNAALTNNLEILSRQLKTLEFAAEDGSLSSTQIEFNGIKSKLERLGEKVLPIDEGELRLGLQGVQQDETAKIIRMSALERRLNSLETILGHDDAKIQALFKTTKCDNLTDVADTLNSWLYLFKPETVQRVNKELDYLTQRLDRINEQVSGSEDSKLYTPAKDKIDHLCRLITSTEKYRAMVPNIIHRLKVMEDLKHKAEQVTTTINSLEQVQSQILDNLQSNKEELTVLNEMFGKNIELIKDFSKDIDSRIVAIRERDS